MTLTFLLTALVVVVTPGTGVLLTVNAGLLRGTRAGLVTAAGCTLGIVPHLAAAVTGAAALLHASGVAFDVVKLLGVAYLLGLAVVTWRDKSPLTSETRLPPRSTVAMIWSAVLANLLNPKLSHDGGRLRRVRRLRSGGARPHPAAPGGAAPAASAVRAVVSRHRRAAGDYPALKPASTATCTAAAPGSFLSTSWGAPGAETTCAPTTTTRYRDPNIPTGIHTVVKGDRTAPPAPWVL